jgi:hypothetical protein
MAREMKREQGVIYSAYEIMRFRMRYVDSVFNRLMVGDRLVLQSAYYKNERMKVIQKTEHLIILQSIDRFYERTAVSKTDYFCGACKFATINDSIVPMEEELL